MTLLSKATLSRLPANVRRPEYDRDTLKAGIVHLGLGAFHRAHQAVFTEDAIIKNGGDWGIVGASLVHPDAINVLEPQYGFYTVEILSRAASYRVMGVLKSLMFGPRHLKGLRESLAAPTTHVVTLTVSEKGYCLDGTGELDFTHPDIAADLASPHSPRSAIGWLALGLEERRKTGAGPMTIISCDNLQNNGLKLGAAVEAFAARAFPQLSGWLKTHTAFPLTLVDCIVPAASAEHHARVAAALGLEDRASVQREPFAQWVIQNRFAGPLPTWSEVGAEIVDDVDTYQRIKLHVLNTAHSALAYLGLPRNHVFVRQAIADAELKGFLDAMMAEEIAPALAPLNVGAYWKTVVVRFENPMIDHRLAQIAEDGSLKLPQRLFPMLVANARVGRPIKRMAAVVRAWLVLMATTPSRDPANAWFADWAQHGADFGAAMDNSHLFPAPFRQNARLRGAILNAEH
ncbi:MAG: mannitol dehydrogenase family protein [Alphaproteobacteria bacterium]|nr:mannitol dehydrogenase family protein [Alphaproteobacteria bacterium]